MTNVKLFECERCTSTSFTNVINLIAYPKDDITITATELNVYQCVNCGARFRYQNYKWIRA